MLSIRVRDAHLLVNETSLVDLRKPFKRIIHKSEGIDSILRTPSETLSRPRKPLSYYVKITNTKAGALYNIERHGLQSHWVYNTSNSVSDVFKDKSLQTILHSLDSDRESFEVIRQYLTTTINFLAKSYNFDLIYTTIPTMGSITKENFLIDKSKLVKLPNLRFESKRYRSVRALLNGHKGGLPARLFDWEVFTNIDSKCTTLDKKPLNGYSNVLILAGTNTQYAGFLAREISKIRGVKEVLPVSLFHI